VLSARKCQIRPVDYRLRPVAGSEALSAPTGGRSQADSNLKLKTVIPNGGGVERLQRGLSMTAASALLHAVGYSVTSSATVSPRSEVVDPAAGVCVFELNAHHPLDDLL
jgi:hypothetical protein